LSCIIPDDGLGIKAETLDFDETDLFQLLMTNLSIVGTMSKLFNIDVGVISG